MSEEKMDLVNIDRDGAVGTIVLARSAKLNALTPQMIGEIGSAIEELEASPNIRVAVLTGQGRAFCVGADVNIWGSLTPEDVRRSWILNGHRVFQRIETSRLPVVAAIHGMAFGGGLELALAADIRVIDAEAKVALPETSIGTVPGWGGTQRLSRLVGLPRAKLMALTGRRIDAATALAWGLATDVSEPGAAFAKAMEVAHEIAGMAPISTQIAKSILNGGLGIGSDATFELLAGMAAAGTDDAREGVQALRERRPPHFNGR
ncbi:enoyl-CoA hydratase/isomerase family protein [Ancylobacter mangrovi]|uniref:enoyl-CoA hydratase/isomerase family protein n=1 Tax=Ancylobacter mangrovi TaxID=2972472 RepID=UPI002162C9A1|nr:enoyl-CoA hydratase/isomerase family protein [Ancylobacter mangrovi]MCS0503355.1 enoyl-CoA hydratase/isomerase family protein [Ancylobacter mangrovi]